MVVMESMFRESFSQVAGRMSLLDTLIGVEKAKVSHASSPASPSSPGTPAKGREPILGAAEVIQTALVVSVPSPCFHCGGTGRCDCISCGHYVPCMRWVASGCTACKARQEQEEGRHRREEILQ